MINLVDIAARHLRKKPSGALFYAPEDVRAILDESTALGNGDELLRACGELVEFMVYLKGAGGPEAARTIASELFSAFAERMKLAEGGEHLCEGARKLAKLAAESTDTGAAMKRPTLKGVGLRGR